MDNEPASTAEMTERPPPPQEPPSTPPQRPAMVRSLSDRKLSGVSSALAGLLGTSVTTARVIFVIGAFFGGVGVIAYALLWLFVPDEQGRVLIRGGARDGTEATVAAITAAIGAAIAASWTFDDTGPLVPLLVGVGIYLLARTNAPGTPGGAPGGPTGPVAHSSATDTTVDTAGDPAVAGEVTTRAPHGQPVAGYGPPPSGPPSAQPPLYGASPVPPAPPPAPRAPAFVGPLTVGIAALVAGVMAIAHATEVIETQPSTVLAVVLGVIGIGLLVSAWVGRARGLILVGLLLIPVLSIATAADRIDLRGGFGERRIDPTSIAALQDTYRLGAGDFRLDLTDLDVANGETLPDIRVDQGVGRLRVFVPEDWSMNAAVEVEFGEIVITEDGDVVRTFDESDGLDRNLTFDGEESAPSLDLELEMFAGVVEVHRELT